MAHEVSIVVKAYNQTKAVFQQVKGGVKDFGKGFADIFKGDFGKGFKQIGAGLAHFGKAGKQALLGIASAAKMVAVAVAAAGVAVIAVVRKTLDAYQQAATAQAKLEQALRNSGNAAGYTASELRNMATEWMKTTGVEDEATVAAMAFLAASGQIRGDNFIRAAKAALDMGAAMKSAGDAEGGVEGAAVILGKALESPEDGLGRLKKAGIQFTQEQEDLIKTLSETGQTAQAQAIILAEVERRYSGNAEAIHKQTAAQDDLKNSFGELMEQVGEAISKSKGFQDAMARLTTVINELTESGKLEAYVNRITSAMNELGKATEWVWSILSKFSAIPALEKIMAMMGGASVREGGRWNNAKAAARDTPTIEDEAKEIRKKRAKESADKQAAEKAAMEKARTTLAARDKEEADALAKKNALVAERIALEDQLAAVENRQREAAAGRENAERARLGLPVLGTASPVAAAHAAAAKTAGEEEKRIAELKNKLAEHETALARQQVALAKERLDIEKNIEQTQKRMDLDDIADKWKDLLADAEKAVENIGAEVEERQAMGAVGSQPWKAAVKAEKTRKKDEARLADLNRQTRLAPLTPEQMKALSQQQLDEATTKAKLMKRLGLTIGKNGVPMDLSPEEIAKRSAKQGKPLSAEQKEILKRASDLEKLNAAKDKAAVDKANVEGAERAAQDVWRKQSLKDLDAMKENLDTIAENTKAGPVV